MIDDLLITVKYFVSLLAAITSYVPEIKLDVTGPLQPLKM